MIHFKISRDSLLKPLQLVANVVNRRPLHPILAHVLFIVETNRLQVIGSDDEVELIGVIDLEEVMTPGRVTLPARKLLDICRSLPEKSILTLQCTAKRAVLQCGTSRFTLALLQADDYPNIEDFVGDVEFDIAMQDFKTIIERTAFSMASQDVRYYLNGLLLQIIEDRLFAVATDAHRLAVSSIKLTPLVSAQTMMTIIPRKGIVELLRLLETDQRLVSIKANKQHIRIRDKSFVFTSKLVEGRFPDYEKAVSMLGDKVLVVAGTILKQVISRAAILANEQTNAVRFALQNNALQVSADNPEQETAQEELPVRYQGSPFEIGFNAHYLLDVLSALGEGDIRMTMSDHQHFVLIDKEQDPTLSRYVVMPLQL